MLDKRPGDPIEAVVFDFGGVIITSITNKVGVLAARHGVDLATMLDVLMGPRAESTDHPWHRSERGEIRVGEVQGLLAPWAAARGVNLDGDEIDVLMDGMTYSYVDSTLAMIDDLAAGPLRIGLLSNLNVDFRPTLEAELDLALFDVVIDSSAEGTRKPEPGIYALTEQRLGVAGSSIVYLDDFEDNLAPAIERGWRVLHVEDPEQAMVELGSLLRSAQRLG